MAKKKNKGAKLMLWRDGKDLLLVDARKRFVDVLDNFKNNGRLVYVGSVGFRDPDTKKFVDIAVFKNMKTTEFTFHNARMISWIDQFQEEVKRFHKKLDR